MKLAQHFFSHFSNINFISVQDQVQQNPLNPGLNNTSLETSSLRQKNYLPYFLIPSLTLVSDSFICIYSFKILQNTCMYEGLARYILLSGYINSKDFLIRKDKAKLVSWLTVTTKDLIALGREILLSRPCHVFLSSVLF